MLEFVITETAIVIGALFVAVWASVVVLRDNAGDRHDEQREDS